MINICYIVDITQLHSNNCVMFFKKRMNTILSNCIGKIIPLAPKKNTVFFCPIIH